MPRKFYNESNDLLLIITDTDDGATTVIVGDDTKITDDEIFEMYKGNLPEGWKGAQ